MQEITMSPMLTYIHIGAGTLSLFAGTIAMVVKKGSKLHRKAGNIFVVAMLLMAALGAYGSTLAPLVELDFLSGVFTCYLVATAWLAAMHHNGGLMLIDRIAPFVSAALFISYYTYGFIGYTSDNGLYNDFPYQIFFVFGTLALLATIGDIRININNGLFIGNQRILRHLWRMCLGFFFAVGSLFLGQQQVFPETLQGTFWLVVPVLMVLLALLYWFVKVRFFLNVRASLALKESNLSTMKNP